MFAVERGIRSQQCKFGSSITGPDFTLPANAGNSKPLFLEKDSKIGLWQSRLVLTKPSSESQSPSATRPMMVSWAGQGLLQQILRFWGLWFQSHTFACLVLKHFHPNAFDTMVINIQLPLSRALSLTRVPAMFFWTFQLIFIFHCSMARICLPKCRLVSVLQMHYYTELYNLIIPCSPYKLVCNGFFPLVPTTSLPAGYSRVRFFVLNAKSNPWSMIYSVCLGFFSLRPKHNAPLFF